MSEIVDRPSPNFDGREGVPVSILMIHYTGMLSGPAALDRLCDPAAKVSAHYLIEEDGTVFRLVEESMRAWHAGLGAWRGFERVNHRSIGIELVNPGHEWGYRPFPRPQMAALAGLGRDIVARHGIAPFDVIAHSDSAPSRKTDPGELFDWRWLAGQGVGAWVGGADPVADGRLGFGESGLLVSRLQADLAAFGYGLRVDGKFGPETRDVVTAFQRHWRQSAVDGIADAETRGRLARLLRSLTETARA